MIEISKELLSEVLINNETFVLKSKNNKIKKMWLFDEETNLFMVDFTGGNWFCINIYELAHKCKEWAYNKGFKIISGERLQDINALFIIEITDMKYNLVYREFHKSEIEAIVKASEWILKEIKR